MNDRDLQIRLGVYLGRFATFSEPPRAVVFPRGRVRRLNLFAAVALVALVVAIVAVPIVLGRLQSRNTTPAGPPKPTAGSTPGPPVHHNGQLLIGLGNTLIAMDAANGHEQHVIFSAPGDDVIAGPAYSPDGTKIAYLQGAAGATVSGTVDSIWVLDTRTGHTSQLTSCAGCTTSDSISWSPDGARLAFSEADQRGSLQVHLIDADGTHDVQLTQFPAAQNAYQPAWSPDGTRIAFTYSTVGNVPGQGVVIPTVNIDVIRTDGTGLAVLVAFPGESDGGRWATLLYPAWSPDGYRILYVLDAPSAEVAHEGDYQLWLVNPDGSHRTMLFHADGCCRGGSGFAGAVWSPDGTRIAGEVASTVWVMNADGSSPKSVDGVSGLRPAWQPVP
jgi:Tol biopolymer transport system component